MNNRISKRTLHRLPSYLSLLEEKEKEGESTFRQQSLPIF